MQFRYVDPRAVERDPQGIRADDGDLSGLAATIRDRGLLQPIGVVELEPERFRVVYGGRRLGAALLLGLERIPCLLLDVDDPDLLLRQILENVQRRDLNDMEKAYAFQRLREQLSQRHGPIAECDLAEQIGQAAGIPPRTVRRYLGLLDLPEEVQQLIRDGELTVTQAQQLRRVPQARSQIELAHLVADESLSAAEVSDLANYFVANPALTVDSALRALQSGVELRTTPPAPPAASTQSPTVQSHRPDDDEDALWPDDIDDERGPGAIDETELRAGAPASKDRSRVFQIRSLDQMVDETDRLSRSVVEG